MKIAVLLTCHNRKNKTIRSLSSLFKANEHCDEVDISVYLTDDGSTDGTSDAIKKQFPLVKLLKGNGSLFWAGGMRNSYNHTLKINYDGFLLLNDDTYIYKDYFIKLVACNSYCKQTFNKTGIYIGSTVGESGKHTYGGSVLTNKLKFSAKTLIPSDQFQECDLGNANIMFAAKDVVHTIGFLHKEYIHGIADYDYTLMAKKNNIPVLVLQGYNGICNANENKRYEQFCSVSLKKRFKLLFSPLGLELRENLVLMRRHFVYRYPFVLLIGYFKCFFPKLYVKLKKF